MMKIMRATKYYDDAREAILAANATLEEHKLPMVQCAPESSEMQDHCNVVTANRILIFNNLPAVLYGGGGGGGISVYGGGGSSPGCGGGSSPVGSAATARD